MMMSKGWYMDYPDDDTTMQRFLEQGVFTKGQIQKAMDNTDLLLEFDDYSVLSMVSLIRFFQKILNCPPCMMANTKLMVNYCPS